MPRIFVAQTALDRWMGAGTTTLEADLMRFNAAPGVSFYINPAVHFAALDGGGTDPYDIIGSVKSSHELAQMGADHYDTSVIIGEYAYSVRPGFVGTPVSPSGTETQLDGATWGRVLAAIEAQGFT
jgi:hypothetical protein